MVRKLCFIRMKEKLIQIINVTFILDSLRQIYKIKVDALIKCLKKKHISLHHTVLFTGSKLVF